MKLMETCFQCWRLPQDTVPKWFRSVFRSNFLFSQQSLRLIYACAEGMRQKRSPPNLNSNYVLSFWFANFCRIIMYYCIDWLVYCVVNCDWLLINFVSAIKVLVWLQRIVHRSVSLPLTRQVMPMILESERSPKKSTIFMNGKSLFSRAP